MTAPSDTSTSRPAHLSRIGIGTGANSRLVDPGVARTLAFAAEELGYASLWTFDSPAGERWHDPYRGREANEVLDTLETFVAATSQITLGAALLRTPWPVGPAIAARLEAAHVGSAGRLVLARPYSSGPDSPVVARTLQMWAPGDRSQAPWASGWMFERWEPWSSDAERRNGADLVVVRLPVHDIVERIASEIRSLRTVGVSEIVLDMVADEGLDHALRLYSCIAEAVEGDADLRRA